MADVAAPAITATRILTWRDDLLCPAPAESTAQLLVADSWLVAGGRVRALDRHWRRFHGSCIEAGVERRALAAFQAAVEAELPRAGRWFPRVALLAGGAGRRPSAGNAGAHDHTLELQLRAAPPPALTVRAWAAPLGDPRTAPRRKGPDLLRLTGLRSHARAAGAGEALIRDRDGNVLEGALSSLLWWEGETLCTTPDATALPAITRELLLEIATRRGIRIQRRAPAIDRLLEAECWLTSALHGIRTVSGWILPDQRDDPYRPAAPGQRAAQWRRDLAGYAIPLPS